MGSRCFFVESRIDFRLEIFVPLLCGEAIVNNVILGVIPRLDWWIIDAVEEDAGSDMDTILPAQLREKLQVVSDL